MADLGGEIAEDYSGVLPKLRVQSSCRCPSAYPRVSPLKAHYCIKNGVPDNTENDLLRLNPESHPLEYVNDGDSNSIWISNFLNQANVIIDLGDEFQVFYVVIQFYSPFPKAVKIERLMGTSLIWDTWQMYAEDCMTYFSVSNDGPLPTSASVNCLKFPR
ncbi:hypothetical protein CHS0354_015760 [Potamilus streckersoni]|uniref:Laminin N-terminal domain-containing protein n=1 Tax=Potamilus streckersoni TaxID=2493646 RepID=A0AAE0T3F0_9BIVA|nr:hypothetical protein CHS0354_015760 [Potamilus streckersoni]